VKWQPVVGFEGHYEVSSCGQVRRCDGRLCGQWLSDLGYYLVRLTKGSMGTRKVSKVHRLVAFAFIANPNNKPCVNHIDHDKKNNRADNLEWCTQKENLQHMHRSGRGTKHWSGRRSPNAHLSQDSVELIHSLREQGLSHQKIANSVGASKRTVGRVIKGETYV
jgi:hypothetical protein